MQEFRKHVAIITSAGIKYTYVLGNHDMYKPNDSKYHALQVFSNTISNLEIIDERKDIGNITFVPYLPDHTKFPTDTKEICIAHQTFIGADYGYMRPEVGVDPAKVAADIIISGHIHIRQVFGKVIYPGTPYSQSVNDIDQTKGVMLFDTDTYKQQFYESPLPRWKSMKYEIASSLDMHAIHEDLVKNLNQQNHWIIDITGPKAEVLGYRDSKEYSALVKDLDVRFRPKFTDKDKKMTKIEAISMERIITEYADKVYKGSIDKTVLTNKALEILNKVRLSDAKHKM
jgi:predicted phosphodiesterase